MRCTVIVQARMGSERLPGKVLKKVLGQTLLEYQLERLAKCTEVAEVIIATTDRDNDDPIAKLCDSKSIKCFRGSEKDVLKRYCDVIRKFNVETVVRITGDCPLIDPGVVDSTIRLFRDHSPGVALASNVELRTFPRGMDTEVVAAKLLLAIENETLDGSDHEHVTHFIRRHPERFPLINLASVKNNSHLRLTVDTELDYQVIKNIIEALKPQNYYFSLEDIISYLEANPAVAKLNSSINQKII